MLTAAVFSDTHGNTARMLKAVRTLRPDHIFHLGDCVRDTECLRREFPAIPLSCVCGNCDFTAAAPERAIVELNGVRVFLTHGHLYNVRWSIDSLVYAAQEAEAKVCLFGHTHEALNVELGRVQVLNPGTAGQGHVLTWGVLKIFDNGGVACEVREFNRGE